MYASDLSFFPDACEVTGSLGPHDSSVKTLSLHHQGRYLLVVTSCDSVLWDFKSSCRYRTLSGRETVGVQDVSLLAEPALIYCQYFDRCTCTCNTHTVQYMWQVRCGFTSLI